MRNLVLVLIVLQHLLPAQTLTRGPSVWEHGPSSFLVAFRTSSQVQGQIEWGPTEALGNISSGIATQDHAIRITGLLPDHLYWYRVRLLGAPVTPVLRTRTFASVGSDVSFFVLGDCGSGTADQFRVASLVHSWDWDLGLLPGDIVYDDGASQDFDPHFFVPYGPALCSTPFFPALGNHDVQTQNGQPFLDAFYLPPANSGSERWYSFDHGRVHFIGLDSTNTSSSQTAWLHADLASARANDAEWIFVSLHHAPYTSGYHGRSQWVYQNWCPIFEEFEVDVVFTGHDHHYERTAVMRDYHPNKRGVVYFVVGTGGGTIYSATPEPYTAFAQSKWGALKVDVRGPVFRSVFLDGSVSTLGQQLDPYTIVRGPATAALRATSPSPQPGQSFDGAFDGPTGVFQLLFASLHPDYVPVPGLGVVHLGSLDFLAGSLIGSTQSEAFSLVIPNQPAFAGTSIFFQGFTLHGPSLRLQLTDLLPARVR
ncbi:MAG TPA: metallophosphoesterase [Planctomycetota bacterium]|nr:metallophosphoesterase [Planctomycetota bacterium]